MELFPLLHFTLEIMQIIIKMLVSDFRPRYA